MTTGDTRRALGAAGERLAAAHLRALGFTLIEVNFRTRHGELDLVAADERHLVFCEVKSRVARGRGDGIDPLESVDARKRRRLRLMAREWLLRRPDGRMHPPDIRFDAIGVTLDPAGGLVALEHVEGAF
jgi:putative endonuclease